MVFPLMSRSRAKLPRCLTLTIALTALSSCVSPGSIGDEESLLAHIAAYDSAWMSKDINAVAQILAPDYLYFSSVGGLTDRAQSLESLADSSYVLTRSDRSEVEVAFVGNVARLSSRWLGEGRYQGEAIQDDQTCGQTWLWEQGAWLLLTEHCVNRPVRP